MSSFWSRILISLAGIPLVLWLVYLGGWALFGLALAAALFALHELYWMTRTLRPVVLAGYLGAIGTLLGAELGGAEWALAGLFATLAFAFVSKGAAGAASVGVTLLGVVWVAVGLAHALLLRDLDDHGVLAIYTVILAVWAGDAGAYFIGLLFGRHKLAPTVSPGKTWEGLIAGTAATIAVTFIALYKQSFLSIPESLALGAVIAVAAPLGDLFESALKRDADVKDSGRLLGGHGGVLDRIDALLFAWVAAYYVILAFT
ncbi:MAG TPA: phosphatidate cytidylyltransferase [Gaiellaceae bacterium]|jgi:phosphatidate cytidylyltransferase